MQVMHVNSMAIVKYDTEDEYKSLKRTFTLIPNKKGSKLARPIVLYKPINNSYIAIPRAYLKNNLPPVEGRWDTFDIKSNIELRPFQRLLVDGFTYSISTSSPYGGIIKSATGTGKTIIGMELISRLKMPTLIVVPLQSLIKQWIEGTDGKQGILKYLNVKRDEIGLIQGSTCNVKGKKIVLAMLHSLAQKQYPDYIYDYFGFTIFDEVHTISAPTFSVVASQFNSKIRCGLSATPRRKDGTDEVFLWHIGNIVSEHTKLDVTPKILVINYHDIRTHHQGCIVGGELSIGRYINRIYPVQQRNELIVKVLIDGYKDGRYILALTDRIDHIHLIQKMLTMSGIPQQDIGIIIHKTKQTNKKIMLATYGSAGMALDIPILDMLVFMTPRADIEQAVGRVTRLKTGKKQPVVVDIVDSKSSYMVGWYQSRMRFYRKIKAEVLERIFKVA